MKFCIPNSRELNFLKILNEKQVEYLLIGGHAMRFYGKCRDASDVDILINNSLQNASILFDIIKNLGHPAPAFREREFTKPGKHLDLRNWFYCLDIITPIDGLTFNDAFQKRNLALQKDVTNPPVVITIPVVSKEHLLFIKQTAASRDEERREKERCDIKFLEALVKFP